MERSQDRMNEAEGDLEHARSDRERGFYNWACFSAQQSAEKAVKAAFQKMGAEAWGHSVSDLLQELAQHHPISQELIDGALELDKAYILTRYPKCPSFWFSSTAVHGAGGDTVDRICGGNS